MKNNTATNNKSVRYFKRVKIFSISIQVKDREESREDDEATLSFGSILGSDTSWCARRGSNHWFND